MIKNKCLVCGSYNLRADRALSGRLVCTSCGSLYGVRKSRRVKTNNINSILSNNKYKFLILLSLFVLILIII